MIMSIRSEILAACNFVEKTYFKGTVPEHPCTVENEGGSDQECNAKSRAFAPNPGLRHVE